MRKGAEHAAEALGVELLFQRGPAFNPTVPVLKAAIARQPDALLIVPTDQQQLKQTVVAGNPNLVGVFGANLF